MYATAISHRRHVCATMRWVMFDFGVTPPVPLVPLAVPERARLAPMRVDDEEEEAFACTIRHGTHVTFFRCLPPSPK